MLKDTKWIGIPSSVMIKRLSQSLKYMILSEKTSDHRQAVKASLALEVSERVWFYLHPRMHFILNCRWTVIEIQGYVVFTKSTLLMEKELKEQEQKISCFSICESSWSHSVWPLNPAHAPLQSVLDSKRLIFEIRQRGTSILKRPSWLVKWIWFLIIMILCSWFFIFPWNVYNVHTYVFHKGFRDAQYIVNLHLTLKNHI
jgi:hypothetical protein